MRRNRVDNHSHLPLNNGMYICLCNAVTDHDIQRAANHGVRSFTELQARTGCSNCCGCCEAEARATWNKALEKAAVTIPVFAAA